MSEKLPVEGYEDTDPRRWLFKTERAILDAKCCGDLSVNIEISVMLSEHQDAKRKTGRKPRKKTLTPEQEARESAASKHIRGRMLGYNNVAAMICLIAQLRHDLLSAREEIKKLRDEVSP